MSSGDSEIGLLRLVALGLVTPDGTPGGIVEHLGAAQAQDLPGTLTALALRTAARSIDDVRAAFDRGEIVRSWPLRGTLHVVPARDLGWMLPLGTPAAKVAAARRRPELGLTDDDVVRAGVIARDTVPTTRAGLFAAWEAAGLDPAAGRGYHLLAALAHDGVLCFGPFEGREPVVVDVATWIPEPHRLDRDEALGEWARRYFVSHGPATPADFGRWTRMPAADVRTGVALAREHLATMDVDGSEYLLAPDVPDRLAAHRRDARRAHLLPGFDEFVLGYGARGDVVDRADEERIVPGRNGMFRATVVAGGRIVGTWRTVRGRAEVEPFGAFGPRLAAGVERAHARLP